MQILWTSAVKIDLWLCNYTSCPWIVKETRSHWNLDCGSFKWSSPRAESRRVPLFYCGSWFYPCPPMFLPMESLVHPLSIRDTGHGWWCGALAIGPKRLGYQMAPHWSAWSSAIECSSVRTGAISILPDCPQMDLFITNSSPRPGPKQYYFDLQPGIKSNYSQRSLD
jgi:hypothetical protein